MRGHIRRLVLALPLASVVPACGGRVKEEHKSVPDAMDTEPEVALDTALPSDCWVFKDALCSPPTPCREVGDDRCYRRCTSNAECPDPAFPKCVTPQLWGYGDWCQPAMFRVCMKEEMKSCINPR